MTRVKETSTNQQNRRCLDTCNLTYAAALVGGRWKLLLIYHLQATTWRFSELRKKIPAITERMLTRQLQELEAAGLVTRTVYAAVPPRVDYALTASGTALTPILAQLHAWGGQQRADVAALLENSEGALDETTRPPARQQQVCSRSLLRLEAICLSAIPTFQPRPALAGTFEALTKCAVAGPQLSTTANEVLRYRCLTGLPYVF